MSEIHLELKNGITPELPVVASDNPYSISRPVEGTSLPLSVTITGDGRYITSKGSFNLDEVLRSQLTNEAPANLSGVARQQLLRLFSPLHAAHQEILNLIIQELELFDARKLTSGPHRWSLDSITWSELPLDLRIRGTNVYLLHRLDPAWQAHMQLLVNRNDRPFLAFEYLHEARRSKDRSAWINATIAAEMAIKEALTRIEPRLSALLLEVPSPPLNKLYGSVLQGVAGERSPYVKPLHKGTEMRNRLVHSPEKIELDAQRVVNYVNIVEEAIWHLIRLCRRPYLNDLHSMSHSRGVRRNVDDCDL